MVHKSLIGFIAHCEQCEWGDEDYLSAQRRARDHVRRTGHTVQAEATYSVRYTAKGSRAGTGDGKC